MKKTLVVGAVIAVASLSILGCSTDAAPKSCVELAREAGIPEKVIEYIERPGDLNALERIAVREALERTGLDDACGAVLDKVK